MVCPAFHPRAQPPPGMACGVPQASTGPPLRPPTQGPSQRDQPHPTKSRAACTQGAPSPAGCVRTPAALPTPTPPGPQRLPQPRGPHLETSAAHFTSGSGENHTRQSRTSIPCGSARESRLPGAWEAGQLISELRPPCPALDTLRMVPVSRCMRAPSMVPALGWCQLPSMVLLLPLELPAWQPRFPRARDDGGHSARRCHGH